MITEQNRAQRIMQIIDEQWENDDTLSHADMQEIICDELEIEFRAGEYQAMVTLYFDTY